MPTTTTTSSEISSSDYTLTSTIPDRKFSGMYSCRSTGLLGAYMFNIATTIIPFVYSMLSKYWVSVTWENIVISDVHTYIGIVAETINEGLPRAAWRLIGDRTQLNRRFVWTDTLVVAQAVLGFIGFLVMLGCAGVFTGVFVPDDALIDSITYARISSVTMFTSAIEVALSNSLRALDLPSVPLIATTAKFVTNIILDFAILRPNPYPIYQATTRVCCDLVNCAIQFGLYMFFRRKLVKNSEDLVPLKNFEVSKSAALDLFYVGKFMFVESAVRNAVYLWQSSTIVAMGSLYATAWSVFNSIRWGVVMVPIYALDSTNLAFMGHTWAQHKQSLYKEPKHIIDNILKVVRPAIYCLVIAAAIEVPLMIALGFTGLVRLWAEALSHNEEVSYMVEDLWRQMDWCYIFYALGAQLNAIVLVTHESYYMIMGLVGNLVYPLPWAIVLQVKTFTEEEAWAVHKWVFGGSLVVGFAVTLSTLGILYYITKRRVLRGDFSPN